jgi:bifunctional non-homologous end joining protein LigD
MAPRAFLKWRSKKIVIVAFDLLYLNGYDLRKLPLFERKTLLKKIISETDIQYSESFEVDGGEMYKHARTVGLEGVVSKVRDSRYVSGRVNDWVKRHVRSVRRWPSPGSRSTARNGMASISAGIRGGT